MSDSMPFPEPVPRREAVSVLVTPLPRWRMDVLSFVPPGEDGYRLLVAGLVRLAACAAFRALEAVLSDLEWRPFPDHAAVRPGEVVVTYRLGTGGTVVYTLVPADVDDVRWQPGDASGTVLVRQVSVPDLT